MRVLSSVWCIGLFLQSGTPATRVLIEAFLDINCPDSAAIWDDIQKVAAHYHPDNVSVKVLWSPLPYHRNTIISTQVNISICLIKGLGNGNVSVIFTHLYLHMHIYALEYISGNNCHIIFCNIVVMNKTFDKYIRTYKAHR